MLRPFRYPPREVIQMHGFRRVTFAAAAVAATVSATVALGATGHRSEDGHRADGASGYTVALFGDMPYGAGGRAEYPRLIQDVNDSSASFSVFDGDLKAGGDG